MQSEYAVFSFALSIFLFGISPAIAEDTIESLLSEAETIGGAGGEQGQIEPGQNGQGSTGDRPSLDGLDIVIPVNLAVATCNLDLRQMKQNASALEAAPGPLFEQLTELSADLAELEDAIPLGTAGDCANSDLRRIERLRESLQGLDAQSAIDLSTEMIGCVSHWENELRQREEAFFSNPDSVDMVTTNELSAQSALVDELNTATLLADKDLNWIQGKKRRMLSALESIGARCIIDLDY